MGKLIDLESPLSYGSRQAFTKKIKVNDVSSLPFPQPVVSKEDMDFGVDLLEIVIGNEASLESELIGKTPNWDPDRIAQLDAIILKIAKSCKICFIRLLLYFC